VTKAGSEQRQEVEPGLLKFNQSVHGNDFWQTDFDVATQSWSLTYNLPITDNKSHTIQLTKTP